MTNPRNTPSPSSTSTEVSDVYIGSHRERDDHYSRIVAQPGPRWRIILCRDGLQWIIQKKEASHAGPWRAEGYYTYRESLIKACGTRGLLSDAGTEAALHALPERLTGNRT